jgi:putative flippase GtrA
MKSFFLRMYDFLMKFLPFSHKKDFRQFYKFAVVGVFNTLIDFIVFLALTRLFVFFGDHVLYANVISFTFAVSNSYILNRRWTFKSSEAGLTRQYIRFFVINLTGLGVNTGLLYIFVYQVHLYDVFGKILAIGITLFWNFFLNKWLVFKK